MAAEGYQVRLVTPAASVSDWTANTLELVKIQQRLISAGITVELNRTVLRLEKTGAVTGCVLPATKRSREPMLWSW